MLVGTLAFTLAALALPAAAISLAAPARVSNPTDPVFINEIHYDNTGTDAGEAMRCSARPAPI
jgi:hypothetical protein